MISSDQVLNALLTCRGSTIRDDNDVEADFNQQLSACINAMSQDDAVGQTLVFLREAAMLHMRHIDALELLNASIERYEMVLFDGGNTHGDRWKHVFFPMQRTHHFVYES